VNQRGPRSGCTPPRPGIFPWGGRGIWLELDLRPFDLKNVNIEAGATSVKLSLGMPKKERPSAKSKPEPSSITIEVPEQPHVPISIRCAAVVEAFEGFEEDREPGLH